MHYVAIWDGSTVVYCEFKALPSLVTFVNLFSFFLKKKKNNKKNVVLDTRDNLCFAGIYQKVLCSAQTASGGWQIGSHFND